MRGRTAEIPHGTMTILRTDRIVDIGHGKRMAICREVRGKPAFVAVTEIRLPEQDPATLAPFVMAVKFLDADVLCGDLRSAPAARPACSLQ